MQRPGELYLKWKMAGFPTKKKAPWKSHHLQGRCRTRNLVRMRDNFTCQNCGHSRPPEMVGKNKEFPKSLDVHHLNGECGKNSMGYDSVKNMDGLITLCHKCHFNHPEHTLSKERNPHGFA